jgi:hypothetical protein
MQALAGQGLVVNQAHPDARGCFFAVPCSEHGGEAARNVIGSHGTGCGDPTWTGTRNWSVMPGGRCVVANAAAAYITTTITKLTWSQDVSLMATILPTNITALAQCILRAANFALEITATTGVLRLTEDGVAVRASSTQPALVAGTLYRLGVRYRRSAGAIDFFINGVKDTVTGVAAITAVTSTTGMFSSANASSIDGRARDLRAWDRALPDAAFERYYYNQNAFYRAPMVARRSFFFRGSTFSGARSGAFLALLRADRRRG